MFEHITKWFENQGFEFCKENPCLGWKHSQMMVLIHVDDIMYVGVKNVVEKEFLPEMKKTFEISEQYIEVDGDHFQFLRRTYEMNGDKLCVHPGRYAEDMIESYEAKMGKAKLQQLPCSQDMLEQDSATPLDEEASALYRSLVGCGTYFSQERYDIAFAIKELPSKMSCPTTGSLGRMGKLIGYLKATFRQYSILEMMEAGHGLVTLSH